jgi:predicted negative regulator of RcsB-dependent stress response
MYFIFDCNHSIVGNPLGYRTFKGARTQRDMQSSKAYKAIHSAFNAKHKSCKDNLISQIILINTNSISTEQALINYYLNK